MYDKIEVYQNGVAIQVFRDVESYRFNQELLQVQPFHLEIVMKDKKKAALALGSGTTLVFLESDYAVKNDKDSLGRSFGKITQNEQSLGRRDCRKID